MYTFGSRLRELRSNKKLTQKELGSILSISESAVGMYERGEREPSFDLTRKISNYFEVSVDYLLGRTDDPSSTKNDLPDELKDPEANIFFKDYLSAPKEKQEELKRFWEYIKQAEKGRKPGDKQGD